MQGYFRSGNKCCKYFSDMCSMIITNLGGQLNVIEMHVYKKPCTRVTVSSACIFIMNVLIATIRVESLSIWFPNKYTGDSNLLSCWYILFHNMWRNDILDVYKVCNMLVDKLVHACLLCGAVNACFSSVFAHTHVCWLTEAGRASVTSHVEKAVVLECTGI